MANTAPIIFTSSMAFFSKEWAMMWALIEINTAGFMYLTLNTDNNCNIGTLFIFQILASCALLIAIVSSNSEWISNQEASISLIVTASIIVNIGIFPFMGWIISVANNLSWGSNTILITWQNIIPVLVLLNTSAQNKIWWLILLPAIATTMAILTISESNNIFISSSLVHTSWMVIPASGALISPIAYLGVYTAILTNALRVVNKSPTTTPLINPSNSSSVKVTASLLSIAGMPPLLGFVANWVTLFWATNNFGPPLALFTLITISGGGAYVYTQIAYNSFAANSNQVSNPIPHTNTISNSEAYSPPALMAV